MDGGDRLKLPVMEKCGSLILGRLQEKLKKLLILSIALCTTSRAPSILLRMPSLMLLKMLEDNLREFDPKFLLRAGENWTLGDNATVAALLMSRFRGNWYTRPAPKINGGLTYEDDPEGKEIRVYTGLDTRMALEDLFAKLALVYGRN